jgi:D-tyrosyl-tRNA(Tyr) deacylase
LNHSIVSQFTLFAKTSKGSKPDFHRAMKSARSRDFYAHFLEQLREKYSSDKIQEGAFGEMMEVQIVNDGPVTITIDSRNKNM